MTKRNFYDCLNEMVTDSRFRNLAVTLNFEHFFNRQGINETETMSFLGWILNPKGSHGFKDTFFREMVTSAWSMIQGQQGEQYKARRNDKFFTQISPMAIEQRSFDNIFVDCEASQECQGADIVITDINSRLMVVINNRYEEKTCKRVYDNFNSQKYGQFENKVFVTFDSSIQGSKESEWCYMGNNWLIDLCANILACPRYANAKAASYIQDFYQFLTGTQYGTAEKTISNDAATLVSDYFTALTDLKSFKAEKITGKNLVEINPREYAGEYFGKISEKEYGILSLYWSYRNTFNTFFQIQELESVTRNMEKTIEGKPYRFDRTFIRGGLRFTPAFSKVRTERAFVNDIFDVELVQDNNKNLSLGLVANKESWDRLTQAQRETLQRKFGFESVLLNDRVIVWNRFYGASWQNKDLCNDIGEVFNKIDDCLANIGIKAA